MIRNEKISDVGILPYELIKERVSRCCDAWRRHSKVRDKPSFVKALQVVFRDQDIDADLLRRAVEYAGWRAIMSDMPINQNDIVRFLSGRTLDWELVYADLQDSADRIQAMVDVTIQSIAMQVFESLRKHMISAEIVGAAVGAAVTEVLIEGESSVTVDRIMKHLRRKFSENLKRRMQSTKP